MKADELIEKNKEMLLQEMSTAINGLNTDINSIINVNDESGMITEKIIHGVALNVGYLTALFNQYYVLLTGETNETKPMGFRSFNEGE